MDTNRFLRWLAEREKNGVETREGLAQEYGESCEYRVIPQIELDLIEEIFATFDPKRKTKRVNNGRNSCRAPKPDHG